MTGNMASQSIANDNQGHLVNSRSSFLECANNPMQWVVARLETKFLKPLPLNRLYFLDAKAVHDPKRITVHGTIFQLPASMLPLNASYAAHKTVFAEGKVSMSKIPMGKLKSMVDATSAPHAKL